MATEAEHAAAHGGAKERRVSIIMDGMATAALEGSGAAPRLEEREALAELARIHIRRGCTGIKITEVTVLGNLIRRDQEVDRVVITKIRCEVGIATDLFISDFHCNWSTIRCIVHGRPQAGGSIMAAHAEKRNGISRKSALYRNIVHAA